MADIDLEGNANFYLLALVNSHYISAPLKQKYCELALQVSL